MSEQSGNDILHELLDTVHEIKRDIAVLTERLANEKDNRDLSAVSYERRYRELQEDTERIKARIDVADRERAKMSTDVAELKVTLAKASLDVASIIKNIQWMAYLVIGLVMTAVIANVLIHK
jgi:chromosome segregation ATPase